MYYYASDYGEIDYLEMRMNQNNTRNKGEAFVTFKYKKDAQKFLEFCDNKEFQERNIK